MKHLITILALAVFTAGFGIGSMIGLNMPDNDAISMQTYTTTSRALTFNSVQAGESTGVQLEPTLEPVVSQPVYEGPIERPSPGDWIKESQIEMRSDGVFIKLSNPQWAILADTNSMDPVFDSEAHLIQVYPTSPNQIIEGDIISYRSSLGFVIVHRVREIGHDEEGWYAIMKGDNNPQDDPQKVRYEDVTRVTVMVVY